MPSVPRIPAARRFASPLTLLALICLLSLTACSPPKNKSEALLDPLSPTAYPQIAALEGLGKFIAFSSPAISNTGDGLLSVTVPIRLTQPNTIAIEYKFEFFKSDGSPITPTQPWQYMNMPPSTQRYAKGSAHTTATKDWRLLLRPAKN